VERGGGSRCPSGDRRIGRRRLLLIAAAAFGAALLLAASSRELTEAMLRRIEKVKAP
jgi:hypothetical protein